MSEDRHHEMSPPNDRPPPPPVAPPSRRSYAKRDDREGRDPSDSSAQAPGETMGRTQPIPQQEQPGPPPDNYSSPRHYGAGGYGLYGYGPGAYPGGGYGRYGGSAYSYGSAYGQDHPSQGSLTMLLSRMLTVIRKKWLIILMIMVFGVVAAMYYLVKTPPTYMAQALIEMSLRRPRILKQQGAVIDETPFYQSEEIYNSRLYKFRGSQMKDFAILKYREANPDDKRTDAELRWIIGNARFDLIKETRIIKITCYSPDPKLAAAAANAYADAADLAAAHENKLESDKAVSWLEQQAELQRQVLAGAEARLVAFRAENNMDALEGRKAALAASLESLGESKVGLESEILLLQEVSDFLDGFLLNPETVGNMPEGIPGKKSIQEIITRWRDAVSDRDTLLTRYTQKHPEIITRNKEIAALKDLVLMEIERANQSIKNSLSLKENQLARLRERIEEQTSEASSLELELVSKKSAIASLEREKDAREVSYMGILNRIQEARLSADENTATVKVIERARPAGSPVSPRRNQTILIGIIVGCLGGLGLAYISYLLEDRIESIMDIETDIGTKVLGLVPRKRHADRAELATASLTDKFGTIPETFASIRTLLDSSQFKDVSHSVLVASATPEEGKTICASNLAITFAKSGKKTLLVDFDMRRPRLARIYREAIERSGDSPREHSLLHSLAESDAYFDHLPVAGPCKNLEVVASQPSRSLNPADILGGQRVRDFFQWAHYHYDRVIVDSPPLGLISDSGVLGGLVGCVVMVCRPDRSRKKLTKAVIRQFKEHGANVVGMIVNGVPISKNKYYSRSGYMNYGYGQRYSQADDAVGEHVD